VVVSNYLAVACLGVCLSATNALAAGDPEVEAKRHFEEGTKHFNLGEFARAASEYRAAYTAKPDPVFLYNIAQSYRLGNDLERAVFFYRSFLRNMPKAPNRREVEDRIVKLEAQLAAQRSVTNAPPNLPVAPGGEQVTAAEPASATRAPLELEPSPQPSEAEPGMRPAPDVAPVTLIKTAPTRSDRQPVHKKWWLWTIVGVAVVGAGLGIGLGVGLSQGSNPPPGSALGTTSVSF
jgi:hypothetical protein